MNQLLIILFMILLSAFFSGMEIAFVSSNKLRIELERKQGTWGSLLISLFTRNPGQYIVTMLIGNNIALVVYGIMFAMVLEPFIQTFTHSDSLILLIQTLISTGIILVTAEFIPKALFLLSPNFFLKSFSLPVMLFYVLFYPISKFTISLSNLILRVVFRQKPPKEQEDAVFKKLDLDNLVLESTEDIPADEEDPGIRIFQNALEFSNVKIRECMVPRTEILAVDADSKPEELQQLFVESGYSKIPVYEESIDNIIGYFKLNDLFRQPENIRSKLRNLTIVPESMPAHKLLQTFVEDKKSMALVVDEFGGTSGMVTIEDVLEEIFGEIEDEHDTVDMVERKLDKDEYILSARLEIDYLNEKYNIGLPEKDEYETLAGWILFHYGSIPGPNETIELDPFTVQVLKASQTKLQLIRLKGKAE